MVHKKSKKSSVKKITAKPSVKRKPAPAKAASPGPTPQPASEELSKALDALDQFSKETAEVKKESKTLFDFSFGILQPMLNNRFVVEVIDTLTLKPVFESNDITRQVISIGPITDYSRSIDITLEDDILSKAFNAIDSLKRRDRYTVRVNILDGNEKVLRSYYLKKANIASVTHAPMSYCSSSAKQLIVKFVFEAVAIL